MNQEGRLKWNFYAALVCKCIVLCNRVLIVPIFFQSWGPEYFGVWLLLSSIPVFLSLPQVGLGTASSTQIVLAIGRGEERRANELLGSAWLFTISTGILVLAIILICSARGYVIDFGGTAENVKIRETLVISILFASFILSTMRQPLEGYWTARNQASNAMLFGGAALGAESIVVATVLICGGRAELLAVMILGTRVFAMVTFGIATVKYIDCRLPLVPNWNLTKALLGVGIGYQLSALWQALLFQGSLFLAQSVFGPSGVAAWGAIRTLTRAGNQLLELINQSLMPEMQNQIAKGNFADARRLYQSAVQLACIIGLVFAIPLGLFGGIVYDFWIGSNFFVTQWIWPIMSTALVLNAIWLTSSVVQRAYNQPWYLSLVGLLSALVSLFSMYVVGQQFGLLGFAVGSVVFEALMAFAIPRHSQKLLNRSSTKMENPVCPF